MEIASCDLYLQPITNGAFEEKFVSEFFCPYFIASLHAITEHGEVVLKGVFAIFLKITSTLEACCSWTNWATYLNLGSF